MDALLCETGAKVRSPSQRFGQPAARTSGPGTRSALMTGGSRAIGTSILVGIAPGAAQGPAAEIRRPVCAGVRRAYAAAAALGGEAPVPLHQAPTWSASSAAWDHRPLQLPLPDVRGSFASGNGGAGRRRAAADAAATGAEAARGFGQTGRHAVDRPGRCRRAPPAACGCFSSCSQYPHNAAVHNWLYPHAAIPSGAVVDRRFIG